MGQFLFFRNSEKLVFNFKGTSSGPPPFPGLPASILLIPYLVKYFIPKNNSFVANC